MKKWQYKIMREIESRRKWRKYGDQYHRKWRRGRNLMYHQWRKIMILSENINEISK